MKKKALIVIVLCYSLALYACGSEEKAEENDSSPAAGVERPQIEFSQIQPLESETLDLTSAQNAATQLDEMPSDTRRAGDQIVADMGFARAEDSPSSIANAVGNGYSAKCNVFSAATETEASLNTSNEPIDAERFCSKISNRLASVSQSGCMAAKLRPSGCSSINGVPLMLREFPPLMNKPPRGRVLVIGGTHGDELTSVSVTFRWIEKLNKHHSGLFHWHIIPALNPDGLLKRAAQRTNENGVDINRNMPSHDWSQNALDYWVRKGNRDPRKFPGDAPNSEPETNWLVDEIELFQPDAIIAVHAPYGVVDFDARQLKTAPKSLGKLHLNLLGTYPGSLGNYAGINRDIPVITLELPHSWVMPSQQETDLIWQDMVSWLKKNLPERQSAVAE